jgi:hypothetical protein
LTRKPVKLTVRFKGRNMLNGYCALNFFEPPLAHSQQ